MYFLMWYDDTKKKALAEKVREGFQAYINRYGYKPSIIGVSPGLTGAFEGVIFQEMSSIRENYVWFGPLLGGPR